MLHRRPFMARSLARGAASVLPALAPRLMHTASAVGQAAPDFTLPDTAGQPVKLSQFRGKPVVMNEVMGVDEVRAALAEL